MAATTVDRNTLARKLTRQIVGDLASSQDVPNGVITCFDTAGNMVNGSDTAGLVSVGESRHRATYSAGDRRLVCMEGVFLWANNGNVTKARNGKPVYIVDNQTVGLAADTTNSIVAGICEEVTAEGVWVSMPGPGVA